MNKLLLLIGLMGCASLAHAQAVRVGPNTVTQQGTVAGASNVVIIPPGAQIQFCNSPANAVPCSNKATTYTDATGVTPCSTSTQIVLDGTTSCVANPDSQGNWGVWVTAGNYQYTITTANGSFGPYFITAGGTGGGGGGGGNPPGFPGTSNVTCGAANNGVTDDGTANTNCINGLATNGGTTFLGNNTLWTPPSSWSAPNYNENIALQGLSTVKGTNPFGIGTVQQLSCGLPYQQSANAFFSYSPHCQVQPQTPSIPVLFTMGLIDGSGNSNGVRDMLFYGYQHVGIEDCTLNSHFWDVFSLGGAVGAIPYESCSSSMPEFGKWFYGGGFETLFGSQVPSMTFYTPGSGVMKETFLSGNGIYNETTSHPSTGFDCGTRLWENMLYENVPVYTTNHSEMYGYDLTGCNFKNEVFIDPFMSDQSDTITPMFKMTGTTGTYQFTDNVVLGAEPTGPWFRTPTDYNTEVAGTTIIGGSSFNILGLYAQNTTGLNIFNHLGAVFANGGTNGSVAGTSISATGVGLGDPYNLSCSGFNSGGSLAAGAYYVRAAYYDTENLEGEVSVEQGPITTTGSSGSISCTWNQTLVPNSIVVGTRLFTGTAPDQENVRYQTTNVGSYTITGSGGTAATIPTQMWPTPGTMSLTHHFGSTGNGSGTKVGDWLGTTGCVAIGKKGCTADTTPGDVQIAGNLTISGTCTGCGGGGGGGSPGGSSGQIQYNAAGSFGGVPDLSFTAPHTLTFGGSGIFTFSPGATVNGITPAMIPTLNQNTSGSAATLLNSRLLAGNSFNGSANVPFTNKFIVQGTTDSGLPNAQFLGALATGILKNTTSTGVLTAAASSDVYALWTGSCSSSTFLRGDGACATPAGTISGLTAGYIPKAGTATSITANSAIDDSITTASTITSTEPVVAPSFTGSGSGAGYFQCTGGTQPTLVASTFQFSCPSSVTTNYTAVVPAAAGTGALYSTAGGTGGNTDTLSYQPVWVTPSANKLDQTGVSTANSGMAQNIVASIPGAGHYFVNVYIDQSAGCTTVGSGQLTTSIGWTDGTAARSNALGNFTPATSAAGTGLYNIGGFSIYAANASAVTITNTYTACMTGTWTYDLHADVSKVGL